MSNVINFKKIVIDAIKESITPTQKQTNNFAISDFKTRCMRKIQLDLDMERYNLLREDKLNAKIRNEVLEEGKLGSNRIEYFLKEGIINNIRKEISDNLQIRKFVPVNFEVEGVQLSGTLDLLLVNTASEKEEVLTIKSIPDTPSKFSIPKGDDLDQLLLYQHAFNKTNGYLIYITRDVGEVIIYKQGYDRIRFSQIKRYFSKLKELQLQGNLAKSLKSASEAPCAYYCKWADYCWGDDAIPPLRYILS